MKFTNRFKGLFIAIGIILIILIGFLYLYEPSDIATEEQIIKSSFEPEEASDWTEITEWHENDKTESNIQIAEGNVEKPKETPEPVKNEFTENSDFVDNEEPDVIYTTVAPLATKEPTEKTNEKKALSCTLTVRCDTLLNNIENLPPEKRQLVPESGVILSETELEFSEGTTAFDILESELKKHKIHFEFSRTSIYDSAYIEGIGNIYEFDAGDLAGWLYRVNGKIPSVGCSQFELKNGDIIEFLYTCDMGRDL